MAQHLHFGSITYSNSLGTAGTSQVVNAWDNVDDDHLDLTGDGRIYEMCGCLDAPERIPSGSTLPWRSLPKHCGSSYTLRQ
jgi:hypothetical protein